MLWIRESLLLYTRFKGSLGLIFEKLEEIELNKTILFLLTFNLFSYLTVFSACISLYLCVLSENFFGFLFLLLNAFVHMILNHLLMMDEIPLYDYYGFFDDGFYVLYAIEFYLFCVFFFLR